MSKVMSLSRPVWISICGVAILVTLIGGNPEAANWKPYIQLPGSFLILYFGWFIGSFGTIMTPSIVRILTILTNIVAYYVLIRVSLFLRGKLKTEA